MARLRETLPIVIDTREFRQAHGLSQRTLAGLLGLTHQAVCKSERRDKRLGQPAQLLMHLMDRVPGVTDELVRLWSQSEEKA